MVEMLRDAVVDDWECRRREAQYLVLCIIGAVAPMPSTGALRSTCTVASRLGAKTRDVASSSRSSGLESAWDPAGGDSATQSRHWLTLVLNSV